MSPGPRELNMPTLENPGKHAIRRVCSIYPVPHPTYSWWNEANTRSGQAYNQKVRYWREQDDSVQCCRSHVYAKGLVVTAELDLCTVSVVPTCPEDVQFMYPLSHTFQLLAVHLAFLRRASCRHRAD